MTQEGPEQLAGVGGGPRGEEERPAGVGGLQEPEEGEGRD